jgi:hypothetical protein
LCAVRGQPAKRLSDGRFAGNVVRLGSKRGNRSRAAGDFLASMACVDYTSQGTGVLTQEGKHAMDFSLADALHGMPLKAGETYRCEVDGRLVELRVLAEDSGGAVGPMLNPWTEFPPPPAQFRVRARPGRLPRPDMPDIPTSGDGR